jgi:hypothetical protein
VEAAERAQGETHFGSWLRAEAAPAPPPAPQAPPPDAAAVWAALLEECVRETLAELADPALEADAARRALEVARAQLKAQVAQQPPARVRGAAAARPPSRAGRVV